MKIHAPLQCWMQGGKIKAKILALTMYKKIIPLSPFFIEILDF